MCQAKRDDETDFFVAAVGRAAREGVLGLEWPSIQSGSGREVELTGAPVPVLDGVAVRSTGAANYDVSDRGRLVYGTDPVIPRTAVWVDRDGNEEAIAVSERQYVSAIISPDGTQLALEVQDQQYDIWVWDTTTQNLVRRTLDAAELYFVQRLGVANPGALMVTAVQTDGDFSNMGVSI